MAYFTLNWFCGVIITLKKEGKFRLNWASVIGAWNFQLESGLYNTFFNLSSFSSDSYLGFRKCFGISLMQKEKSLHVQRVHFVTHRLYFHKLLSPDDILLSPKTVLPSPFWELPAPVSLLSPHSNNADSTFSKFRVPVESKTSTQRILPSLPSPDI